MPAGPILFRQRNQLTVHAGSCVPSCVSEQHQREQPGRLRVIRHQREQARESNRFVGQVDDAPTARSNWCSPH